MKKRFFVFLPFKFQNKIENIFFENIFFVEPNRPRANGGSRTRIKMEDGKMKDDIIVVWGGDIFF